MAHTIFLSHIHEETELAKMIKDEIEAEFSGFVNVFVSSDGVSIPAGTNFLNKIEEGLVNCIGAIYLISPYSVKRSWINFELGAVWIRSAIQIRGAGKEIPAMPFCHSGMKPSMLPQPLGNLNAIDASASSQLEFAFRSLQTAVGGKGTLRTDFDALSQRIIFFERKYMLGDNLASLFRILGSTNAQIVSVFEFCDGLAPGTSFAKMNLGTLSAEVIKEIQVLESNQLAGKIKLQTKNPAMMFPTGGGGLPFSGAEAELEIEVAILQEFRDKLMQIK